MRSKRPWLLHLPISSQAHSRDAPWVEAAFSQGLLRPCGTSPELVFCPEDPLSRAEAAVILVGILGVGEPLE